MVYNKTHELSLETDNSILQESIVCFVYRFCQIKLICINIGKCDASSFPGILSFQTRTQDYVGNILANVYAVLGHMLVGQHLRPHILFGTIYKNQLTFAKKTKSGCTSICILRLY